MKGCTVHPAIEMLRAIHKDAWPGIERGSCCATDLAHDERAINANADCPFAWAMSPTATYMTFVSTARKATDSLTFMNAVIDVERGNPIVMAIWDGTSLRLCKDAHDWKCGYERESRRLRLEELTAVRATFKGHEIVYADRIKSLDSEIADLRSRMGWGGEL